MLWSSWPDPTSFLTAAEGFLRASPLVNQIPLGIVIRLRDDPGSFSAPTRLYTVHDGACVGVVVQTPPNETVISRMTPSVAAFAGAQFAATHPDVDGVFGEDEAAVAFLGGRGETAMGMGLFALHAVNDVPRPGGHRRLAASGDAVLLQAWLRAFHDEAVPHDPPLPADAAERSIARGRSHVWIDQGKPVAYARFGRDLDTYVSIGPVYTPPAHRGRGFATALVAEMSAAALAEGRQGCTLFTDLTNPTSNRIYERIGYVRIGTMKRLVRVP